MRKEDARLLTKPKPPATANPHLPGELHPAPSSGKKLVCFYCQQTDQKVFYAPLEKQN